MTFDSKVNFIEDFSEIEKQVFKRRVFLALKETMELREKLKPEKYIELKEQMVMTRTKTFQLMYDLEWLCGESFYPRGANAKAVEEK